MGMSMGSGGARRSRRGHSRRAPMSEINVTPMVDVMLVLLIIFMVAAPMLTVGVPIELPKTQAKALNSESQPITISVNAKGEVYINDTEIAVDEVVPKLEQIAKTGYQERIFVKGDRSADYGTVMQIMGRINAAGFKNIGLVTDQDTKA
ncbi:protein TolR [Jiella mangrovi]|uniref:Protein TolR n=1 Tax=Jiella mangrovi TaxID=2821407 RepID=A0ABS4BBU2_9HYPH|nr:protein TolR [Jiella mangrovi]MBP0614217.1 protein TolR [Jiella mangrovi]